MQEPTFVGCVRFRLLLGNPIPQTLDPANVRSRINIAGFAGLYKYICTYPKKRRSVNLRVSERGPLAMRPGIPSPHGFKQSIFL